MRTWPGWCAGCCRTGCSTRRWAACWSKAQAAVSSGRAGLGRTVVEQMLAVGLYLGLGVTALALGWAWLAPRLPRRVRLTILMLAGALAVLALAVSAQVPHDYRPE